MPDIESIVFRPEPAQESDRVIHVNTKADTDADDLGYYEDGTRRTLSDEQIAMFRHSEIQRLLAERRRREDIAEDEKRRKVSRGADGGYVRNGQAPSSKRETEYMRYDDDQTVHLRKDVGELSYEENADDKGKKPKTFNWPILGS